jgi:uroporphyrinogen III methyltransferase / synthase
MTEKPLASRRIIITRARKQAGGLAQRIAALGGEAIVLPTIEIEAPKDFGGLDAALARIESYHWLIITSVNSIDPLLARLAHSEKSLAALSHLKIAAVGAQTATRLAAAGISVALVPARFQAEGVLDALDADTMRGKRVLIPQGSRARDVLAVTLRQWGAEVDVVEAYRTVSPTVEAAAIKRRLQAGEIDIVTFTSSSTVINFAQLFGGAALAEIMGKAVIACIGPITAKTVEELGGQVAVMAREATIDGLVAAIVDCVNSIRRTSPAKPQCAPSSDS